MEWLAREWGNERLGQFIERLPDFERALAGYKQDGNADLLASLERSIETAAASKKVI
jgi:hypothetical protein